MGLRMNRNIPVLNQSYMNKQQMESLQAKRKKKLLMRRLSVFFVFAAIILFTLLKTIHSQGQTLEAKKEQLKVLQNDYDELIEQQDILEEEIIKLQDDEYIGKYARQEFFLSNDGEIIFSIPNDEDKTDAD